jgi:hypothetical protein
VQVGNVARSQWTWTLGRRYERDRCYRELTHAALAISDLTIEWHDAISRVRDGVGALGLTLSERDVLAGNLDEGDQHVVRRHIGRLGDSLVDVF